MPYPHQHTPERFSDALAMLAGLMALLESGQVERFTYLMNQLYPNGKGPSQYADLDDNDLPKSPSNHPSMDEPGTVLH